MYTQKKDYNIHKFEAQQIKWLDKRTLRNKV